MFANINTIDVNHLDMDRKKDARPILTVQSCVRSSVTRSISELKIYEMNHIYTIDSHIVIRSPKHDS